MHDSTRLLPGSPRAAHDDRMGPRVYTPWTGKYLKPRDASKQLAATFGTMLYAVAIGDEIKIGYTGDVVRRLDTLRCAAQQDCRLLAIHPGTRDDERELHRTLAPHRTHGREWYYPTPEVLALVNEWRADLGQEPIALDA